MKILYYIEEDATQKDELLADRQMISENIQLCLKGKEDIDGLVEEESWRPLGGLTEMKDQFVKEFRVEKLINNMRKRPKMYVAEIRIDYIFYFLFGYCGANHELSEDDMDRRFCFWFGKWLIKWIEDNVDKEYLPETAFWYDDIRRITRSEQDEAAIFFELCEYFFKDYRNKTGYFSWRCEHDREG